MQFDIHLDKNKVISWITNSVTKPLEAPDQTIRFVDLFSGCGGLSFGIQSAAQNNNISSICALALDIEPAPLEVYRENIFHEEGAILNNSILDVLNVDSMKAFSADELALKESVGEIDILVAGPPCQGHSDLNNSTRRKDPRNALYLACIRAVRLFDPNLVIIENVPTVIHSTEGVVKITEDELIKLGYTVRELKVDFLSLGIPQSRKRHVLIASKDASFSNSLRVSKTDQKATLREFFAGIEMETGSLMSTSARVSEENAHRIDILFDKDLFDLPNQYRPSCHRDKSHSYNSMYGRLAYDKPAQTLTSGYGSMGQGRYVHPENRRTITSREAARIQGFPDSFDFSKVNKVTSLRKMIANAVPPQLTYVLSDYYFKNL